MADKDIGPRIGADPEVFVMNTESGEIVPICGHIGGTKEHPIPINDSVRELYGPEAIRGAPVDCRGMYAVQEDNVMLEFNVPAYKEYSFFSASIEKALTCIKARFLDSKNLTYKFGTVDHGFKEDVLQRYPQTQEIGCVPDLNAYAEDGRFQRPAFSSLDFGNRRFCGGHIHVQYDTDKVPTNIFAQFMDCYAGLPVMSWDRQRTRRLFYGQPGLHRRKSYGIEYRTLSNFWIDPKFRERHLSSFANQILLLAGMANTRPDKLQKWYGLISWDDVQQAIKTEDTKLANQLIEYMVQKLGMDISRFDASRAAA